MDEGLFTAQPNLGSTYLGGKIQMLQLRLGNKRLSVQVIGTSCLLVISAWFLLNLPAIQLVQAVMAPTQVLLIIPFVRLGESADPRAAAAEAVLRRLARKHVGLYAYRREALERFASLPPSPLEEAEGLEQLRALHHGMRIRVVPQDGESGVAVDTPRDLERVRALLVPERGTRD
jgi:hypothetical protein